MFEMSSMQFFISVSSLSLLVSHIMILWALNRPTYYSFSEFRKHRTFLTIFHTTCKVAAGQGHDPSHIEFLLHGLTLSIFHDDIIATDKYCFGFRNETVHLWWSINVI